MDGEWSGSRDFRAERYAAIPRGIEGGTTHRVAGRVKLLPKNP